MSEQPVQTFFFLCQKDPETEGEFRRLHGKIITFHSVFLMILLYENGCSEGDVHPSFSLSNFSGLGLSMGRGPLTWSHSLEVVFSGWDRMDLSVSS